MAANKGCPQRCGDHDRGHGRRHYHGHSHGHAIDDLAYQSHLRYVNATEKLALACVTLVVLLVSRSIAGALFATAALGVLTVRVGGICWHRYRGLMLVPFAFLVIYVLVIGTAITTTPFELFAVRLFGSSWYLTASWGTVHYAAQLFFTALGCVSCLYFLSCNTPMTYILEAMRRLHIPPLFIELTMLIYRYIFVLLERAEAIRTAQDSRLGNVTYARALQTFGDLCSCLFVQAIKRAGRLFDAMEARGYDGRIVVLSEELPPHRREIAFGVAFELVLVLIILIVRF